MDLEEEKWKTIIGWEGYEISSYGKVKSKFRIIKRKNNSITINEKILKSNPNERGYLVLRLCRINEKKTFKIHRLVALHFVNNVNNTNIVNHKNGNILDNHYSNLEWITQRENVSHGKLKNITKSSNYIGVSWDKVNKKWSCSITHNGKTKNLGRFLSEEQAYLKRLNYQLENNLINKYDQKDLIKLK